MHTLKLSSHCGIIEVDNMLLPLELLGHTRCSVLASNIGELCIPC